MSVANEHFCSLSTRMQALAGSYVAIDVQVATHDP